MLTLEQTKELYDFLQGKSETVCSDVKKLCSWHHTEIIKSINIKNYNINILESHLPKLTKEQALLVIYVLQKVYHMISDTFKICEDIFIDECHDCKDYIPIVEES